MNKDQKVRAAALALGLAQCIGHDLFPPTGTVNRLHNRNEKGWILDWQPAPEGGVMAIRDGFEINAYDDGTWVVAVNDSSARIVHDGRAKNPRLRTAMNATERWFSMNADRLKEDLNV